MRRKAPILKPWKTNFEAQNQIQVITKYTLPKRTRLKHEQLTWSYFTERERARVSGFRRRRLLLLDRLGFRVYERER
jgi:hypothetical protein